MCFMEIIRKKQKLGFTILELLITMAIVGILSAVVIGSLDSARDEGREGRAIADLEAIYKAMLIMNIDTEMYPNNLPYLCEPLDEISSTNEFAVSDANAGFITNGRGWVGWGGPYLPTIPTDPWGNEYYFDDDYRCLPETQGCQGYDDSGGDLDSSAIVSCGPNGAISSGSCSYDTDNIIRLLCRR